MSGGASGRDNSRLILGLVDVDGLSQVIATSGHVVADALLRDVADAIRRSFRSYDPIVRLATGEVGFGYPLGRDRQKARMIALCDALVQSNEFADAVETGVLAPLRTALASMQTQKAAETAATRVDFYTLVRGEG